MNELASVTFVVGLTFGLSVGFMVGTIWQLRAHIADLKDHIRFTEEYSASVAKLLDDTALAVLAKRDGEAS